METPTPIYHIPTMEKRYIIAAINRTDGAIKKASVLLGISERTLYRKIREHYIEINGKKLYERTRN